MSENNNRDIIKSPSAGRMLRMVTDGFYDRAYIAGWIFEVIGREYDEMAEWAHGMRNEMLPQTCIWSISIWEWVYGIIPDESLSLAVRRNRIMAQILTEAPINPEVIRQGIMALTGSDVLVTENVAAFVFSVIISQPQRTLDYLDIWRYIRRVKPSHMAFTLQVQEPFDMSLFVGFGYHEASKAVHRMEGVMI